MLGAVDEEEVETSDEETKTDEAERPEATGTGPRGGDAKAIQAKGHCSSCGGTQYQVSEKIGGPFMESCGFYRCQDYGWCSQVNLGARGGPKGFEKLPGLEGNTLVTDNLDLALAAAGYQVMIGHRDWVAVDLEYTGGQMPPSESRDGMARVSEVRSVQFWTAGQDYQAVVWLNQGEPCVKRDHAVALELHCYGGPDSQVLNDLCWSKGVIDDTFLAQKKFGTPGQTPSIGAIGEKYQIPKMKVHKVASKYVSLASVDVAWVDYSVRDAQILHMLLLDCQVSGLPATEEFKEFSMICSEEQKSLELESWD